MQVNSRVGRSLCDFGKPLLALFDGQNRSGRVFMGF
jgi:hypothetical protein